MPEKGTWYDAESNAKKTTTDEDIKNEGTNNEKTGAELVNSQSQAENIEEESEDEVGRLGIEKREESHEKGETGDYNEEDSGSSIAEHATTPQILDQKSDSTIKERVIKKGACVQFETQDGKVLRGCVKRRTEKASGTYRKCWEVEDG